MKNMRISENFVMTKSIAISLLIIAISLNAYGQNSINGHECVDLGLSVLWATCNVGASNPSDNGSYFAWGETNPKTSYTEYNCTTWDKYIGDIAGNPSHDAARTNWGSPWRMPTKAEIDELVEKCEWQWMTMNGHNGYKVTGPNGYSIFLPATGSMYESSNEVAGRYGNYYSSTPIEDDTTISYCIIFSEVDYMVDMMDRGSGLTVRAVARK